MKSYKLLFRDLALFTLILHPYSTWLNPKSCCYNYIFLCLQCDLEADAIRYKAWLSHPHGVGFGGFSRFWVGFPTRPEMVGWEHLPPETPTPRRWDWHFGGLGESWKILIKFDKYSKLHPTQRFGRYNTGIFIFRTFIFMRSHPPRVGGSHPEILNGSRVGAGWEQTPTRPKKPM